MKRSWLSMSRPSTSTLRMVTPLASEERRVAPLKLVPTKVAPSKSLLPGEVVIASSWTFPVTVGGRRAHPEVRVSVCLSAPSA